MYHKDMEIRYGAGHPAPTEMRVRPSDTAVIGFAGAYAGGHNNAQYEQMLRDAFDQKNVLTVPSASSKYAFKNQMLSRKTYADESYYRKLADTAIERFSDKDTFLIHCHSGGSVEGIAFARALLAKDDFRVKKIHLVFSGAPGFAEKQAGKIGRMFEFLGKFIDSRIHVADDQQFDLCPPPEEYYDYLRMTKAPEPAGTEPAGRVVYRDTPEKRKNRRETFYTKYMAFLPQDEKTAAARDIGIFDRTIMSELKFPDSDTEKRLKTLLHERAKIVYDIGGNRYYNEYLANKPEYKNVPAPGLDGTVVGAQYLLRLLAGVAHGLDSELLPLMTVAEQRKKDLKISFGQFEHDTISSIRDVPTIKDRLTRKNAIQAVDSWLLIEGLSHESIDNTPQGIGTALLALYQSEADAPGRGEPVAGI